MERIREFEIESRIRKEVSKILCGYPELKELGAYTVCVSVMDKDMEPTPDNLACVVFEKQFK